MAHSPNTTADMPPIGTKDADWERKAADYIQSLVDADHPAGLVDLRTFAEYVWLACGSCLLLVLGPLVGVVVGLTLLWEAVDRGFRGGFTQTGQELSGFLCSRVAPWITRKTANFNMQFVKQPQDTFIVNCVICQGVVIPVLFMLAWWYHKSYGFSVGIFLLYHAIRLGPYFMNFAYVYSLCHKEGHSRTGLWKGRYNNVVTRNIFNWWVGLFYGVLPAAFAFGHSINHHRYNNGPKDVISTSDRPRDNWVCFLCYLPRFMLYATNISTTIQFAKEGNDRVTRLMIIGSMWYYGWVAAWYYCSPSFALGFIFYPFFENVMLLAGVSWSWHSFLNPLDPEDEYVQSITIIDGPINVLNEDFHVVHHQYPGGHWTLYQGYREKHWEAYREHCGSVFKGTHAFEILFMLLLRDWDALAERFQDLKGQHSGKEMSKEEKIALLKSRARGCWWGLRAPTNLFELSERELGNLDDGKKESFIHERLDKKQT